MDCDSRGGAFRAIPAGTAAGIRPARGTYYGPPMPKQDEFAALFESTSAKQSAKRRLRAGEVVEGPIVHIGADSIFVDVGTPVEGRIDRAEFVNEDGGLRVKVGDRVRATVIDPSTDGPVLATVLGRGAEMDVESLKRAQQAGAPVTGKVTQAVKGGLEVDLAGARAFCPASQIEIGFTSALEPFVGQTLEFRVIEIRDGGRSVVVSRRALLEDQRRENQGVLLASLAPGAEIEGSVSGTNKHGALIDIGSGIVAFAHVSELASHRVDRPEDAVTVGDRVRVRVLSVETTERGPNVRVSLKAAAEPAAAAQGASAPAAEDLADVVLPATVIRTVGGGVVVQTPKGEGFVPLREIELAPGADHRRAFPAGREIQVVVVRREGSNRLLCSARGVAAVEERRNYREFAGAGSAAPSESLGSLGDLLRKQLNLPPAEPEARERARSAEPISPGTPASPPEPSASQPAPRAPVGSPRSSTPPSRGRDDVVRRRRG